MLRMLGFAAIAASISAPVFAQNIGPPIAFTRSEAGTVSIYLTNPNGMGTVRLHSAPKKSQIVFLDLKPGGGEIAFIEGASGNLQLKLLAFDNSGKAIGSPRTISTQCRPSQVDYQPGAADPLLLISEGCYDSSHISTIRRDGTDYQIVRAGSSSVFVDKARWMNSGADFIYVRGDETPTYKICRASCEASGDIFWTGPHFNWMDVARISDNVLYSGVTINRLNLGTREVQSSIISGGDGHYSPDDQRILYETPYSAKGTYLEIRNADGSVSRITQKGNFGSKDWRQ